MAINIDIVRSNRRKRTISIQIQKDGSVAVRAPSFAKDKEIHRVIDKQQDWIRKKVSEWQQRQAALPASEPSKNEVWLFGEPLPVLIEEKPTAKKTNISLTQQQCRIQLSAKDKEADNCQNKINTQIDKAYRQLAGDYFQQRLESLSSVLPWVQGIPPLKLRKMKSRWGSCSRDGRINLNTYLIKAPTSCIDYVILHELCHIKEHNHGAGFYKLMDQVMPGWPEQKQHLNRLGSTLLHSDYIQQLT